MRNKLLFKVRGVIVSEEFAPIDLLTIFLIKERIMIEQNCTLLEIKTQLIVVDRVLSEYDISVEGIINYTDMFFESARGITLPFKLGSNEHLDNINNLESFLVFY